MKLTNDTYAYATGKGAQASKLAFTALDSVDLVTPFLESGAIFIATSIEKRQGQTRDATGAWVDQNKPVTLDITKDVEEFKLQWAGYATFPLVDPTGKKHFQTRGFNSKKPGGNVMAVKDLIAKAKGETYPHFDPNLNPIQPNPISTPFQPHFNPISTLKVRHTRARRRRELFSRSR